MLQDLASDRQRRLSSSPESAQRSKVAPLFLKKNDTRCYLVTLKHRDAKTSVDLL